MSSFNIPLTTLPAHAVIDDSVIAGLKQQVATESQFDLVVARNVGTAPLDGLPAGLTAISLVAEWTADPAGVTGWQDGESAQTSGGPIFADKAQTIRIETFEIHWPFRDNFPLVKWIRGRVVVGPNSVSVSGSGDLI